MNKNCCDIAWILAIGYIIMVPAIIILVGIIVGYHFRFKWDKKNKEISAKPPPFEEKIKVKNSQRVKKGKEKEKKYRKKTTKKGKKKEDKN